jgi:hypothetical protein
VRHLPGVLSQGEVARLIEAADTPFHRILLMTMYATGARRAEAAHLKVSRHVWSTPLSNLVSLPVPFEIGLCPPPTYPTITLHQPNHPPYLPNHPPHSYPITRHTRPPSLPTHPITHHPPAPSGPPPSNHPPSPCAIRPTTIQSPITYLPPTIPLPNHPPHNPPQLNHPITHHSPHHHHPNKPLVTG